MKKATIIAIQALCLMVFSVSCKKEIKEDQATVSTEVDLTEQNKTKTLSFGGLTWYVKNSTSTVGPQDNYWSDKNAWVDDQGRMHLKINWDAKEKKWNCAEVYTKTKFGFGKYEWRVEGRIDKLDKNVVFGLFNYSGNDYNDELDIEFSKWGNSSGDNLTYTVWPAYPLNKNKAWSKPTKFSLNGTYTTHRFDWSKSRVKFQSLHGFQSGNANEFYSKTCGDNSIITSTKMPLHMNLWLIKTGKSGKNRPSDGKEVEVIIHAIKYPN